MSKSFIHKKINISGDLKMVYCHECGTKNDDDTDNRLEAVIPNSANTTFDLVTMGPGWNYTTLPGSKGSIYKQGPYGDVKPTAGGNWYNGAYAGSRYRSSSYYRWAMITSLGGRFASEPI